MIEWMTVKAQLEQQTCTNYNKPLITLWRKSWELQNDLGPTQYQGHFDSVLSSCNQHQCPGISFCLSCQTNQASKYNTLSRMRQINEDRRRRALLLSKRLNELAVARRQLVVQLEVLDAEARAAEIEVNSLHNSNAPISTLPDEMLAMIFEAGSLLPQEAQYHFGSLVSHVSQHWRNITLATPRLWNKIYCIKPEGHGMDYHVSYPNEWIQRDATYLERSRLSPLEIYISGVMTDDYLSQEFLQLIRDHMAQCRRLSITDADGPWLSRVLEYLLCQPVPLLNSIDLACHEACDEEFELNRPLFPLGAPQLATVQLDRIEASSLPFCLPAFTNITSLKLTQLWIDDEEEANALYSPLQETLMNLQTLNHLELQLCFLSSTTHLRPPMVLPTTQFLKIDIRGVAYIDDIIPYIHAISLTTLSISGWSRSEPGFNLSRAEELHSHFPSLRHLILRNISPDGLDLQRMARRFPGIEQLTCHGDESLNPPTSYIYQAISIILATPRSGYREDEEDEGDAISPRRWPKLHTVAVKASNTPLEVVSLHDDISHLQLAGHPISKLKLPKHLWEMAGAEAMAHLRTVVEVEDFSVDWPTPFEFI